MNYEFIGTVASVIVLASFLMNDEKHIRIINILGASFFVAYGLFIHAFSVWFLNAALILIHVYKLSKYLEE